MLNLLKTGKKVVGLKQSSRAICEGTAKTAFIARDAQESVREPFAALCREHGVPIEWADNMEQLGKLCEIDLGAAAAVLLK